MTDEQAKPVLQNMGAYIIYTSQKYNLNDYSINPITNIASTFFLSGNIDKIQEVLFLVNKQDLLLDNSLYNMMAGTTLKTFYSISVSPAQYSFTWPKTEVHMRLMFTLNLDHTTNTRNTYTFVQLISDTGGFIICLSLGCSFVIKGLLQLNVSLENKIMNTVFRRKITDSMHLGYVNVNYRQYIVAVASSIFCLRRPRNELWRKVAMRRVNRELDVANFIRKQFIMYGLLKGITTSGQRALLKRSYNLMVPGAHDGPTTTDSDSDYEFDDYKPTSSLDFILVNRMKKNQRNSLEPVDQQ